MAFYLMLLILSSFLLSALVFSNENLVEEPWNLPVFPKDPAPYESYLENSLGKKIPRHLWMAFKEVPKIEDQRDYLKNMLKRNAALNWTLHLADNNEKLKFMETYFSGTSLLWAYKTTNPQLGVSAADIWRYGVLWLFGGLYMDDDSYIEATFDELIAKDDTLVLATEKNSYNDDCFVHHYKLSAKSMVHKYNRTVGHLFGGRTLVSWAIFSAPRNKVMEQTMVNVVDLIKLEFLRKSVVNLHKWDVRWKLVMCTTGPAVLTASARETILKNNLTVNDIKVYKRDFHEFGGVFKMWDNHQISHHHYMHTMQKYNYPLLIEYANFTVDMLEGRLISGDGKEIYLIRDGKRKSFTDFDTFLAMDFSLRHVLRIPVETVESFLLDPDPLTMMDAGFK